MITNEVKSKIFALYLGCKFQNLKYPDSGLRTLHGVYFRQEDEKGKQHHVTDGDSEEYIQDCQIILTPLEEITYEHAILIAKMQNTLLAECGIDIKVYKNAKQPLTVIGWISETPVKVEITEWNLNPLSLDKLRDLGYHTPCKGLINLYRAEIAVIKPKGHGE